MWPSIRKRLIDLSPILIFAILVVIFFWKFFLKKLLPIPADITVGLYFPWLDYKWGFPTGVPVKNPLPSDIPSLVYPWRIFVIEQLRKLSWPLWNPYSFSGMPLLANFQPAVFSLANIFFLVMPAAEAWSWGVIIQPFLAAIFTYIFLRHLKVQKFAAFLGGIIFAFCGFNIIWMEYNVHGHTGMWLPILLLVADKIIQEKKPGWVLLGGAAFALQVFAGYPQIVLYSLTAVGFYAIWQLFFLWKAQKNWRHLIKPVLFLVAFVLVGALLAAVQILPGIEALGLSVRKIDPIAQQSSGGFLPWQNLITFLAPDFFGNPATYNFWGKPWYDNFALYIGIFPLLLALIAVFIRKDKPSRFFVVLAVFALCLALPTPAARAVNDLGIYGVKAISARIIFLLDFSLAVLGALGVDFLMKNFEYLKKEKRAIFLVWASLFLVIIALWLFTFQAGRHFPKAEWLVNLGVARHNLILPTALLLASLVVFVTSLFLRKIFSQSVALGLSCFLVLALSVFDVFRFGWKYLPFSQASLVFPSTPVIDFLRQQPQPFRAEFGEVIPQNMWLPYGLESAAGYDALAPLRYSQFLGAFTTKRADRPFGRVAQIENYNSPLFDLVNIKYVLAVKYDEKGIRRPEGKPREVFQKPKFKLVFEDKSVQVYENKDVIPRAFIAHDYFLETGNQEIIDKMLSPDFSLSKSVVLEEGMSIDERGFDIRKDSVKYLKYEPKESIIRTNTDANSILVVTDSFYPGWKAFLDGEEVKIYRANFAFRAVSLPAGEHKVRFIYDPPTFRLGLFISLATLVIILAELGAVFFVEVIPGAIAQIIKLFKL
jgi:hypothetical protein